MAAGNTAELSAVVDEIGPVRELKLSLLSIYVPSTLHFQYRLCPRSHLDSYNKNDYGIQSLQYIFLINKLRERWARIESSPVCDNFA